MPGFIRLAFVAVLLSAAFTPAPAAAQPTTGNDELARQVRAAETDFARTMEQRDRMAFESFVSEEAVFFGQRVLRGRAVIVDAWGAFFNGPTAPFSWRPETVEVLDSGTLALTSGPVRNAAGEQIGTFNSIWRRDTDGRWRVVFDKGCP